MLEAEDRTVDESYKELIEEYHTNTSVLAGRMEYHISSFEKLLNQERENLNDAFVKQKTELLKRAERSWQALIEGTARESEEQMENRLGLIQEQKEEMDELIQTDYEHLGELKNQMEQEVRALEEQISMVNAFNHLNTERLDYEIHVLNKHEDENAIIKSEQKRKITMLQDTVNKLKYKVKGAEKESAKESELLADSVQMIKKQIADLEEKQRRFGAASAKTRGEMSKMMKEEAYQLLEKITKTDEVLQSLYLNAPFSGSSKASSSSGDAPPSGRRASRAGLTRLGSSKISSRKSSSAWSKKSSRRASSTRSKSAGESSSLGRGESMEDKKKLRKLLMSLIERADFLVEEDLNALMEVLPDKDKLLLKVDSILNALGVTQEKDIEKIFHHLAVEGDADAEVVSSSEKRSKILKILRMYVEEPVATERSQSQRKAIVDPFSIVSLLTTTIQPDASGYMWEELEKEVKVFRSADRSHLKKLLVRYKDILLSREEMMKKSEKLKTQNGELRMLLKNYLDSQGK